MKYVEYDNEYCETSMEYGKHFVKKSRGEVFLEEVLDSKAVKGIKHL